MSLYPNPARDNLTVKLPFPARQVSGTAVVTAAGEGLMQDGHRVKGEYELEIPVGQLRPGLYLLRLRSEHGQQVVRFVKGNEGNVPHNVKSPAPCGAGLFYFLSAGSAAQVTIRR